MKRLIIILTTALLFLSFPVMSAGAFLDDKEPYSNYTFSLSSSQASAFVPHDYYILTIQKNTSKDENTFRLQLSCIDEGIEENKGRLYFYFVGDPASNYLYRNHTQTFFNFTTTYTNTTYYIDEFNYLSDSVEISRSARLGMSNGFVFEEKYIENDYPFNRGTGNGNTATIAILASNVDIYDYTGDLLQKGDTAKLLEYCPFLKVFNVQNYVEEEETPTEPTTENGGSGSSGGDSETTKGILSTVKSIFEHITNLPSNIASSLGSFFTSLGDTISIGFSNLLDGFIVGLKSLFVPSDNLFIDMVNDIKSKFGFVLQLKDLVVFSLNSAIKEAPPNVKLDLSKVHYGDWYFANNSASGSVTIIDWEFLEQHGYIQIFQNIFLAVTWFCLIRKIQKRLPNVINGVSSGGAGS